MILLKFWPLKILQVKLKGSILFEFVNFLSSIFIDTILFIVTKPNSDEGDFPGSAACFQCRGLGSIWWGAKTPHMPCGVAKKLKINK